MGCKPETEEALHGCSENAHVHYPGSGNAVGHRSLVPVALVRRGGDAFPLGLADWFAPSTSRNRALFLVCGGEAILFHSLLLVGYVLLVGVVVHLFVVFYEEPSLRRPFGESYETYLRAVPRWLPRYPRI